MTQQDIAEKLGVSRRTVQDLEYGIRHAKSYTIHLWAEITKHDKDRDIRRVLYPDSKSPEDFPDALNRVMFEIKGLYDDEILALDDSFHKDHVSDRRAAIHLFNMYLRCDQRSRIMIASHILSHYDLMLRTGYDRSSGFAPDMELVRTAVNKCMDAYLNGEDRYYLR